MVARINYYAMKNIFKNLTLDLEDKSNILYNLRKFHTFKFY